MEANTPTPAPLPALVLDRETLVAIYNAKITQWNDPAIVALNPDLKSALPDAKITVVHRSDGSGTTEMITKALAAFSTEWTAGGASSVEWPVDKAGNGIGGKGNPGVAASVQNTPIPSVTWNFPTPSRTKSPSPAWSTRPEKPWLPTPNLWLLP